MNDMKNNNKGFSLVELLMTMTITVVMISSLMPVFYKQLDNAQVTVCEINRREFSNSFKVFKALDTGDITLEDAINGKCSELCYELADLKCPKGGTYSVENGEIVCSVHGPTGSYVSETGEHHVLLTPGDTVFGHVLLFDWEDLCSSMGAMPLGSVGLTAGTVFVQSGAAYVVSSDSTLTQQDATLYMNDPGGLDYMQPFDPCYMVDATAYNSSVGWIPSLLNGIVCEKNGSVYVFLGSSDARWVTPPPGDNWVLLS